METFNLKGIRSIWGPRYIYHTDNTRNDTIMKIIGMGFWSWKNGTGASIALLILHSVQPNWISIPLSNVVWHLTHWSRVTHICVSKLTIIGADNGLSPGRRQAVIWTNAGILLIGPLGTNFSEISIGILIFSFKKMRLKLSSAKRRPLWLGLNVLRCHEHNSTISSTMTFQWFGIWICWKLMLVCNDQMA